MVAYNVCTVSSYMNFFNLTSHLSRASHQYFYTLSAQLGYSKVLYNVILL